MVDIDTDLLRAFLAVLEEQGFTAAARRLNRSQSAVSMQVRRLEERVGRQLLLRGDGPARPSEAGELFLGYARRMLALNDEALRTLGDAPGGGRVRLGVMDDYGAAILPPLLAQFRRLHPQIAVELRTGLTGRLLEQLGEAFELVIAMHPPGAGQGRLLRREPALWIAPPDAAPEQEAVLPLALYPQGCLFRAWALAALDGSGRRWRIAFESPSLAVIEAAVRAGLGIGVAKAGTTATDLRRPAGLPELPVAEIALHRAPLLKAPAQLMAEFLEASLDTLAAAA
jgi:DNA-binding transcriptional LysR family regulator